MNITLYTYNILESGTVAVTGTPDTEFPASRLYDRCLNLYWKDTVTVGSKNFVVDQGASGNVAIDFLAINKHNFNGKDMQWQWSTDNFVADINDVVVDWTQGDNLQITQSLSWQANKRYWRVTVSTITNPACGEIFMSLGRSFEISANPPPVIKDIDNVRWQKTIGGIERSSKSGDVKKSRRYTLLLDNTDVASFRNAMLNIDNYSKPFYIQDERSEFWLCRLLDVPAEKPHANNEATEIDIDIIEIL